MFDGLKNDDVTNIVSSTTSTERFDKGDELYRFGYIGILKKGIATIRRLNDIGDSITIRTICDGELFGMASLFGDWKDGMSSIIADSACEVIYFSEEQFTDIIKKYPQFSINYIKYLSEKIRFLNQKLDAFTTKTTEERLY